jgi:hypothetical protein
MGCNRRSDQDRRRRTDQDQRRRRTAFRIGGARRLGGEFVRAGHSGPHTRHAARSRQRWYFGAASLSADVKRPPDRPDAESSWHDPPMRSSRTLTGSSRAATLTAVVLFAAACAGSDTDIAPVTAAASIARTEPPIAIVSPAETATPATEPPVEIDLGPLTGNFPIVTVSSTSPSTGTFRCVTARLPLISGLTRGSGRHRRGCAQLIWPHLEPLCSGGYQ